MHELPLTARLVLWLAVPPEDREFVSGDLVEDAGGLRGRMVREAVRSLPALLRRRWQRGGTLRPLAASLLAFALPVRLLDLLAAMVGSGVPYRDDNQRSLPALLGLLAVALAGATLTGLASERRLRATLFVALASGLCVVTTPAVWPAWFRVLLLVVPASVCWFTARHLARE